MYQLKTFALATRAHFLFHMDADTDTGGTTRLGAMMKTTGTDELCYSQTADTEDTEGKLKVQFWRIASELFVEAWKYGEQGYFNILLNTPPQFFQHTIMYKDELPQVRDKYPNWRVTVYV